ncbi:MarR family winged helix-turn-helix transcriptional regulator [Streptomyces himalayensis]|uniref:MarR family transcriptional regulator n=1 Tax=Streptomyces himalayensis subsp. himalayensis TaxID=2756131 RepID=A0A7W0IDK2_9ACTN|nr:MarR family transcriptional regulator [Streptomyces himalayensis]MBA2951377.1 MarR family transcriptional regulator [Streptomyces himalayensis subsp. himalayensis]
MTGISEAHMSQGADHVAAGLVACLPVLNRYLKQSIDGHLPYRKLPERQLALLQYVAEHDGATVHKAAEALRMMPNNVSALVTRLTDAGLLERHQDDTDKRVAHLCVTAKARQRLSEVENIAAAQFAAALRTLTDGDRDALGSALGALEALTRRLRDHSA